MEDIDRAILMPKKDEPIIFKPYPGFEDHPVRMVSFLASLKYTMWLSNVSGKFYRLPTEAEWEYAARGGKLSKCHKDSCYIFAGSFKDYEVVNMTHYTQKVGSHKPNELGIYDMSGNVWEFCSDWFKGYSSENQTNPRGASLGENRVVRGGGLSDNPGDCRVASRYGSPLDDRGSNSGFRLVLSP